MGTQRESSCSEEGAEGWIEPDTDPISLSLARNLGDFLKTAVILLSTPLTLAGKSFVSRFNQIAF